MAIYVLYRQERTGSLAEHCTLPTPSATAATPPSSLLVSALRSSCPAGWTGPWSRITAMAAPAAAAPLRAVAPWRDVLKRALGANRGVRHSRYVQLATVRPDGRPANRSVVYRGFLGEDSDVLTFVTDSRCLGSAARPLSRREVFAAVATSRRGHFKAKRGRPACTPALFIHPVILGSR